MFTWPSSRDWIFSIKAFVASMLALYIALALGLPRPYWAMATVYIVSHPLTGATRSKALYRVLGTLLGAAASIAFVPALVNTPELLMAAVGLWTGTLLYISLLHRSPRSYVFLLASYTLPLIALPAVNTPDVIFDIAIARSEEIILGIVCASVVGAVVLPTSVAKVLHDRSARWLTDAARWTADMLSADPDGKATRHLSRHRMAADILALDQLISQLSYDADTSARVSDAQELRGRMTMMMPVLSTVASLVQTLRRQPQGVPDALAAKMADVVAWLRRGAPSPAPAHLLSPPQAAGEASDWYGALVAATEDRLRSLVQLWQDCATLQRRFGQPDGAPEWSPAFPYWELGGARHYDHGLLLFSTVSAALCTFLMGMAWIYTGWNDGAAGVSLGAVACCFFAAMDEPAPFIRSFFWATAVCVVFAAVYVFFILTNAHDFGLLVSLFAVPYLLLGTLIPQPRFTMVAMLVAVNTASFVGIQGGYSADFSAFFNSNIAGLAGVLFALLWTLQTRPFGTRVAMRRLIHASWRDIARNALGRSVAEHGRLRARLLDRLGQLVPRLAASESETSSDGFTEVRVELSALALQRELPHLNPSQRSAVEAALNDVARFYQARLDEAASRPDAALQDRLLGAVRSLVAHSDQASRSARASLMDIHVALFPATRPRSAQ
ncbi:FUSC family protein [Pandoraea pulmonicola]|uniref:Transporter n=1 Tax=Pandoraea pulmonicola TaxID=93221 RepID=A0AAJ4ZFD7_PANPU|nr:FUSC family protein [Pandoraea pulmonicola]AJC19602.1 transporter [Pandoraea pulmonicola]SUA92304.1 p-hydroxybenzoic acid efflux pump subunit AaeB [Pandoraea pulmonicola]